MSEIKEIIDRLVEFRDARDWSQFHNSKDLALAISIEAGELLEAFLWKSPEAVNPLKVKEELADVLAYCLLLAHHHNLDIKTIIEDKIRLNEKKYPVEKARGNASKYTDL